MLAEKVYNLNSFKRQYEALLTLSVCDTIPNLIWDKDKSDLLSRIDWNNILSIASLFSYYDESKYLDAALRIAQTCLMQETITEFSIKSTPSISSFVTSLAIKSLSNKLSQSNKNC